MNVCHLSDGSDVLYNKFNPAPHPNSNYSCVVAEADQWIASRCDDQRLAICQSNFLIPGNYLLSGNIEITGAYLVIVLFRWMKWEVNISGQSIILTSNIDLYAGGSMCL